MQRTSHKILKVILILFFVPFSLEEECTIREKDPKCLWIKPGQPSILVNASDGGFCNQMFNAVVVITMNLYMNMSIFMPRDNLDKLKKVS